MRTASVMMGTLLVVGAAVALVNCGGDDSSPTGGTGGTGGSGATGGSGGSTGGSGGTAGSTGGSAGTAGSSGAGMDSSATGGSSGAAGNGGKAGSSGAAGSGGKAGSSGAAGSAGSGGKAGSSGSAGASMDASSDGNQCPSMQPLPNTSCDVSVDCTYGSAVCMCVDPGPNGNWICSGGPPPDAGGGETGANCPTMDPSGTDCPDAGLPIGPCRYGNTTCNCDVGDTRWNCITFTPAY